MMPEVFSDSEEFENWFNFDGSGQAAIDGEEKKPMSEEAKFLVIQIMHRILKPFMLRRTKEDRATKLPKKIEMNISVGLSQIQMKLYQELLESQALLDSDGTSSAYHNILMQLRKVCDHPYMFEGVEEEG